MKKQNEKFYGWMKKSTTLSVPSTLDDKILSLAQAEFRPHKKSLNWALPLSAVAASFIIFLAGSIYLKQQSSINELAFNESPEMILNYDNIELMADASLLSDEDWKNIEGME